MILNERKSDTDCNSKYSLVIGGLSGTISNWLIYSG